MINSWSSTFSTLILKSPDQRTPGLIHQPSLNPPCPSSPCPAQLRAVLQGEEVRRLCRCSSRLMPVVTDLEYDAFISGQPPHSEQILVVCVRVQRQPLASPANQDLLEQLYERMNKNRAMPCTQVGCVAANTQRPSRTYTQIQHKRCAYTRTIFHTFMMNDSALLHLKFSLRQL